MDYSTSGDPTIGVAGSSVSIIVGILLIIALWGVFSKAGKPGWYAIIPILNVYTLVKISGNEGWWTILYYIPIINIIALIVVSLGVAKNFGRSGVFAIVGLVIFGPIGYLILGFGSSRYEGPALNA